MPITTQKDAEDNLRLFISSVEKTLELSGNIQLRDMFRQFVKEFKNMERVLRTWDRKAVATSEVITKKEPKSKLELVN